MVKQNHEMQKVGAASYTIVNERNVPLDHVGVLLEYLEYAERVLEQVEKTHEEYAVLKRMSALST
jgi:hypothetical protein